MKRSLSSLVAVLCLLAFFVSSAACLAAPLLQPVSPGIEMHSMSSSEHACCPKQTSGSQMSGSCCTVHHQPASPASATDLQQANIAFLAAFPLPSPTGTNLHITAAARPSPQQPPLIALRI